MRATLVGSAGPLIGREFSLDKPVVSIGRRDENDIVIKDPTVSRNHARIRQEGDELILNDNGSTSGTVVNGVPLTGEHRLRDGDIIVIGGNATFAVQIQPDDEGATIAFSRDQLPGMLPQGEPSDPGLRAARENYQEAGRTSFIPTADLGGNEPPALFDSPPASPPAQAAPAERAPEPPPMGGGYAERGAFPSPPPAPPRTPHYDPEATNILQPPPAREPAPAAGGWTPATPPPAPPPASGAPGGVDLGGDTVSWPAPPRDELPGPSGWPPPPPRDERPAGGAGWALPPERSQPPTPASFEPPPSMTPPPSGYGPPPASMVPPDQAMAGPPPAMPYPAAPGYATPPPPAAAPAAPAARRSRRGLVIAIVAVLIIAIGLLVALTFFLVRRYVSSSSLPPDLLGLAVQAALALATS